MNKKQSFGINIIILVFSSILLFVHHVMLLIAPFVIIPGYPKEMIYIGVITGYVIGVILMYFTIRALWLMGTKTVVNQDEKLG